MSDVDTSAEVVEQAREFLGCPFCGRHPHHGKTKKQYCQLHGEPYQMYQVRCPRGHATIIETNRKNATLEWNTRQPINALLAERDELRAEVERLRQALKFYACDCAKLGDECGERLDDVLCGNTARSALKEKENDQ